jgi:hypothetical protein
MAKRPERMKSTLAGSSPVTATPEQQHAPQAAPQPAPEAAAPAPPAAAPKAQKKPAKTKVAYYQAEEDAARVRGGFQQVGHQEGYNTFSDFHAAVLMQEIERLEAKYNGGKPFEGAAPKSGRLGRPME